MDLSDWISEVEAARLLGIVPRQLREWVTLGKAPDRRMRPRQGKKPEPVYDPEQVRNMAPRPPAQVLAPGDPRLSRPGVPVSFDTAPFVALLARVTDAIERRLAPPPPQSIWIKPEEGAQILGLTPSFVKRAIRAGHIPHVRDGQGYKVRRSDLEHLELASISSKLHESTAKLREVMQSRKAGAR